VSNKVWDVIAVAAIAFALWKIFVAPRSFAAPGAHPVPHAAYERLDGSTFRVADQRGMAWHRRNPGALIVPVDVGEPRSTAAAFAQRYSLGNVALDPQSTARALFDIKGFPTMVVIDSTGHVRANWEGLNPAIALALTNAARNL
jgi:hypothetical protein